MTTLVIAEHDNTRLSGETAKALTAAAQLGRDIHLLVAGEESGAVAEAAAKLQGVSRVLHAENAAYRHRLAEPLAALIVQLAPAYGAIVAPATAALRNALPRVAALLDVTQVSDVTAVRSPDTFERPIYAGNAVETVRSTEKTKVLTIRTAAFTAVGEGGSAPVESVGAAGDPGVSTFVSEAVVHSERPELSGAKVVVSGGRALGSKEKFEKVMLPLAEKLGAAVGASRAAVDAGYAPNDWQVGQTGKVVAPDLYIACGISGAIQHLAGMKDAKVIVAINKDEEAPIFQVADYGLVGDIFEIVPELTSKLQVCIGAPPNAIADQGRALDGTAQFHQCLDPAQVGSLT